MQKVTRDKEKVKKLTEKRKKKRRKSLNFYEIRVRAIEKKDDITYTIS